MRYSDHGSREAKELPEALIDEEKGTWGLRRRKSRCGRGQGGLGPKSASLSHFCYLLPPLAFCGGTLVINKAVSCQGTSQFTKLCTLLVP